MLLVLRFQGQGIVELYGFGVKLSDELTFAEWRSHKEQVVKAARHGNFSWKLDLVAAGRDGGEVQNIVDVAAGESGALAFQLLQDSANQACREGGHGGVTPLTASMKVQGMQKIVNRDAESALLFADQRGEALVDQRVPERFIVTGQCGKIV